MALNWSGAGSGALGGATAGSAFGPWGTAIGGVGGGLLGLLGGGDEGPSLLDVMSSIIRDYSYMPKYTEPTEASLFDLFQRLTGQGTYAGAGNGNVAAIPFDIGLPTTGLYDSLTRGIKEDYLGTPGGPEGGQIADTRAYYNNLGIPEYAINQERLGYRDLNNSLLDQAAKINELQKDRLSNLLNIGYTGGQNLYSQNLQQHRFNAGLMGEAAGADFQMQDSVDRANAGSIGDLFSGAGSLFAMNRTPSTYSLPTNITKSGDAFSYLKSSPVYKAKLLS
jgi:hypothetical protein